MNEPVGMATKLPMMLVSLLLSFGLWMYVQVTQPANVRYVKVPVQPFNVENMPKNLIVGRLDKVYLEVSGTDDVLSTAIDDIDNKGMVTAYVDLSSAHVGVDDYPLKLSVAKRDLPYKVSCDKTLSVNIDQKLDVKLPITVEEIGQISPGKDLAFNGATAEPSLAHVEGPINAVRAVKKLRAFLDLSMVDSSSVLLVHVEPLDDHDQAVQGVTVEPDRVGVSVAVAPAPLTSSVLVDPVMTGQPAIGYTVTDFSVEPNQLAIQGAPDVLARIRKIRTRPIVLSDLRATTSFEVPLDLPPNVKSYSVQRVRVRVTIEPKTTSGTADQSISGPN
jgi:YbbR domain-containing protein